MHRKAFMDLDHLRPRLEAAIEEHEFAGVIRISHAGEAVYERAAGYADRANRLPNTMETRFGIASGTKLFTALAIGGLIGSGKVALGTRLEDIIDLGFPQYSEDITIQHLLTHTSGIPDYYDEEKISDFDGFTVAVPWSELRGPRDYLAVFPDEPMKFTPGERFSYSNGGYITLGIVIEEISGRGYRDFVASEIFEPAGMSRSGYFPMNRLPGNTALGYVEEDDGWRTNIYDLPIIGASDGGAFTTVGDMTELWDAFWAHEILPEEIVNIFTKSHSEVGAEGKDIHYGHGIWIYQDNSGTREE